MEAATEIIKQIPDMPMDRLNAMIALSSIGVALFALYLVFTILRERRDK